MPICYHADDFGITRSATQGILTAWDRGALNRFSVMANGPHLAWGLSTLQGLALQPRRLAVHLNLLEGEPLSSVQENPMLHGEMGTFPFSFLSLLRWQYQSRPKRDRLAKQVLAEWRAQTARAQALFPEVKRWSLDSHQHVHTIPWLWEIALGVAREFSIPEIRIPRDSLFEHLPFHALKTWPRAANVLKVRLINRLIRQHGPHPLSAPCFVGGLYFSGEMQRFPLEDFLSRTADDDREFELLYHPGDTSPATAQDRLAFPAFYRHPNRRLELRCLTESPRPPAITQQ